MQALFNSDGFYLLEPILFIHKFEHQILVILLLLPENVPAKLILQQEFLIVEQFFIIKLLLLFFINFGLSFPSLCPSIVHHTNCGTDHVWINFLSRDLGTHPFTFLFDNRCKRVKINELILLGDQNRGMLFLEPWIVNG